MDTDATLTSQADFGDGIIGFSYGNAISNFFFSSPRPNLPPLNLSGVNADFEIAPSIVIPGLIGPLGVISGVSLPSGCSIEANSTCLISLGLAYSGDVSQLPELSDDPNSYRIGLGIELFDTTRVDPTTGDVVSLGRQNFTSFQVRQRVPESGSGLSILAIGIGGLGLRMKRNLEHKTCH